MSRILIASAFLLALLGLAPQAHAQSPENDMPDQVDVSTLRKTYAIPDVPDQHLDQVRVDEKFFTWTPGVALIYDFNHIDQDDDAVAAVGEPVEDNEWRSLRFTNRAASAIPDGSPTC